jgi:hypothetical protein
VKKLSDKNRLTRKMISMKKERKKSGMHIKNKKGKGFARKKEEKEERNTYVG